MEPSGSSRGLAEPIHERGVKLQLARGFVVICGVWGLNASGAVGGSVGFVIEDSYPQYSEHAANVGTHVEARTGSTLAGGFATVVTTLPLSWAASASISPHPGWCAQVRSRAAAVGHRRDRDPLTISAMPA